MSLPQIFLNLHHEVGVVLEQELFLAHLTLNINVHASVRRSSRALVSVGAVGATATTDFQKD